MNENDLWELPKAWCWSEVAPLVDGISAGKSFKCDERPPADDEIGVVKVSAVTWGFYNELESKTCTRPELVDPELFVRTGDFLFSRANTIELVGACVIADRVTRKVMLSDKILRFSVRSGWDRWLLWSLRSSHGRAEIERLASGNQDSMRNIGQSRILSIRIPIPPQGEQGRVVDAIESYFSRLDDAVTTLERVERNLKRYRASVLKSAVEGRLVPTEAALAKQEGRTYEPASVLLERILSERRRRWSESGKKAKYQEPTPPDTSNLPKLPEGWCWSTADALCDEVVDCHNKTAPYVEDGIPLLRTTNIRDGLLKLDELRYVTEQTYAHWSRRCPPEPGDVLFTREAPMGEAALVPAGMRVCMGQRMMLLRANPAVFLPRFLLLAVQAPHILHYATHRAVGSGVQHLRVRDVESLPIPLAPLVEQYRIVDEAERQLTVNSALGQAARLGTIRCLRLRQSILKWAFEGKLADQDFTDEPASVLLERIKAERDTAKPANPATPQRKAAKKKARA